MADEDLKETIEDAAAGPAKASVDGRSAEQHKLTDLIEADRHLARRNAAANPLAKLIPFKIKPPGSA